jgi:hypothetical protein
MANMAPQTAYQGSKGMKRVERSAADRKADKRHREGSGRTSALTKPFSASTRSLA